jgi:hypothetical protein
MFGLISIVWRLYLLCCFPTAELYTGDVGIQPDERGTRAVFLFLLKWVDASCGRVVLTSATPT